MYEDITSGLNKPLLMNGWDVSGCFAIVKSPALSTLVLHTALSISLIIFSEFIHVIWHVELQNKDI